jgi:hypothetical protein
LLEKKYFFCWNPQLRHWKSRWSRVGRLY